MAKVIRNPSRYIGEKYLFIICLGVLFASFVSISTVSNADWNGGYSSEKLISRQGISDSNIFIGTNTVSYFDIATCGTITTNPATGIGTASTNLHATVLSLNGIPSATVYFEWGYNLTYGNTSAITVVTATGNVETSISGYNPNNTVYYRAVIETDGTAYGAGRYFSVGSLPATKNVLNTIILVMIGFAMILVCFNLLRNGEINILEIIGIVIMLIVIYYVIQYILRTM